jgi:hypothetical protein
MAVRIPVVVSQSERRAGAMADYEEQLVTRLIFENGLDATLIADLKSIALDTTDHLCVEGLKGDFALACWESASIACEQLHRLGIPSLEILPMDGGPRYRSIRNAQPPKIVFFVSLTTSVSIESTIQTLRELRDARAIPVVSLGAPKSRGMVANETSPPLSIAKPLATANFEDVANSVRDRTSDEKPEDKVAVDDSAAGVPNRARRAAGGEIGAVDDEDSFPNIDELMDDLDKFEL